MSYPFKLSVLSLLMGGTQRQVDSVFGVDPDEVKFRTISYSGAYTALKRYASDPDRALQRIQRWRDDISVKPRTRSFREGAYPGLEWCARAVLPRMVRVRRILDGDRQTSGRLLVLAGQKFSGGFHADVVWADGSRRLVYLLGPRWPRKRLSNMLALLQMKSVEVYGLTPEAVVVVDANRRELLERQALDPRLCDVAISTASWLKDFWHRPKAS